ncbi:hypothetical protein LCGC14_1779780 [marine sediment metagenome]|uniref:Portal protein n=1 Tax=marine sediment metagenome TaxID=412755 RepID=A0A0F9GVV9_9ZZZZ
MKILTSKQEQTRQSEIEGLIREVATNESNYDLFTERIAVLELALEDQDWLKLDFSNSKQLGRDALQKINDRARMFWLKNPLIRRATLTQANYVFGQGVEISSDNEDVNEVIQAFIDDQKNKAELTDHETRMIKEIELQLFANIYFVFFTDAMTGKVLIRTIPEYEIHDIIADPEDSKTPLWYKRVHQKSKFDFGSDSQGAGKQVTTYYKDWKSTNEKIQPPKDKIAEDAVIYHVAVNKLSDMKFGVSEVYSALDWSKAYTKFLEDWSTITRSYATFAWNMVSKNKTGVLAAKAKLSTTLSSSQSETNPPPVAGSTLHTTEGSKMEPIKTAGATTKAEDGDKIVHMVSAATGIFFHYLTGDPSTGNLATAKAMELPMQLQFKNRQKLWVGIYTNILNYVIEQNMTATKGKLKGARNAETGNLELVGEENLLLNISFPDILEKDTTNRIDAIIKASTLDGKELSNMIEAKTVARLLLEALGEKDIDEMLDKMFPDGQPVQSTQQIMEEAFDELKEVIKKLNFNGEKVKYNKGDLPNLDLI